MLNRGARPMRHADHESSESPERGAAAAESRTGTDDDGRAKRSWGRAA